MYLFCFTLKLSLMCSRLYKSYMCDIAADFYRWEFSCLLLSQILTEVICEMRKSATVLTQFFCLGKENNFSLKKNVMLTWNKCQRSWNKTIWELLVRLWTSGWRLPWEQDSCYPHLYLRVFGDFIQVSGSPGNDTEPACHCRRPRRLRFSS